MTALLKSFAKLWTRGQVKPTGVPRIDWSHPLAQGLVFYGFDTGFGLIVDLVRGRAMQAGSASGGPTPALSADQWSAGFLYDAGHTNYFASDAEIRNLTAAPPLTFPCALYQLTLTNGAICFCRTANNSAGQPYMDWCFQSDFAGGGHTTFAVNSGGAYTYVGTAGSTGTAIGANNSTPSSASPILPLRRATLSTASRRVRPPACRYRASTRAMRSASAATAPHRFSIRAPRRLFRTAHIGAGPFRRRKSCNCISTPIVSC